MKKLLIILASVSFSAVAQKHSCCELSVTSRNAMLASSKDFAAAHEAPRPFKLENGKGKMITFPTADGTEGKAYLVSASKPSDKVLFVFQEWWGLNDYIKREADRLQSELGDVTVYALDLYDGKVAATPDEAKKYMGELKEARGKSIIAGAIKLVGPKAKIGTIGWCLGGSWSLQSTLLEGKQAVASVVYYGMPEGDVARLKTLNCDVLGIFAKQDHFITPEVVTTFEAHMKEAGKKLTVYNYDADHAFANPSNPKYNKEFAEEAHAKVLAYLKEKLK